jgi:hypothetical protein
MISESLGVSLEKAEHCIIKSIYGIDALTPEIMARPRHDHIKAGVLPVDKRDQSQVVLPLLVLAIPNQLLQYLLPVIGL